MPNERDGSLDETLLSDSAPPARPSQQTVVDEDPGNEPAIKRGDKIGRYEVVDRLGSGTMGVVLAAIDPTLDRKVAIKLLRADATGSTIGRQRLLREAQAMAKLSHPNVVTVFEVGTHDERIFLAMEYVAGRTLGEWTKGKDKREIVGAYLQAGHGLAAAHRAGIVHRDFKPANVLVAEDGRVRVADFGLATAADSQALAPGEVFAGNLDMTKTGSVLGTPAYMAPEQHQGKQADARADQFAFCVALYEALYGQLPFAGDHYAEYVASVLANQIREPAPGSSVPAWIRKVLVHGLAVEPDARYPSMQELLQQLARDPRVVRQRIAIGAGLVAAATVTVVLARTGHEEPCANAEQPLAALWSATDHSGMARAFEATGNPNARTAYERTARVLDERVRAMRSARRDACMATARNEQSAELLDRRMACIDQRAAELSALVAILSDKPTVKTLAKAVEAAANLPPVTQCADRTALLASVPPPASPELRDQVAAISVQLERADALFQAGRIPDATALTDTTLAEADATGFAPVRARAAFYRARNQLEGGELEKAVTGFRAAGELAAVAHDDVLLARIWTTLYGVLANRVHRLDEARSMESIASAAVLRAGNTLEQRAVLENTRGVVAHAASEHAKALEHMKTAEKLYVELFGENHPRVAGILGNEAMVLEALGRYEDALAALDRALAIRIEVQGPDHPDASHTYFRQGAVLDSLDRDNEALAKFEKAAEIDKRVFGDDTLEVATDYVSIGVMLDQLDRSAEARTYHERAIAVIEKFPDEKARLMQAVSNLGDCYRSLAKLPDAIRAYDRAIELAHAVYGDNNEHTANVENNKALALLLSGDRAGARQMWQRALATRLAVLGPDHPDVAKSYGVLASEAQQRGDHAEVERLLAKAIPIVQKARLPLAADMLWARGESLLQLKRYDDAIADLTQARELFVVAKRDTSTLNWLLAEALWGKKDKAAARAAMTAALDEIKGKGSAADPKDIAEIEAWLASHR